MKSKHKQSMTRWIILNKHMSFSQKIYKLYLLQSIRFGKYLRYGSLCILTTFSPEPNLTDDIKTLRHALRLMKKGYIVRIERL